MKITFVTVPGDLRKPPTGFPFDLMRCMDAAVAEGHNIRLVDNHAWRASIDVVKEEAQKLPPDVLVLSGPLEAVRNMLDYAKIVSCPSLVVGDKWRIFSSEQFPLPRICGAPEEALGRVLHRKDFSFHKTSGHVRYADSLPYPSYSWLPLDMYGGPLPYGPIAEQWKLRLDVEVSRGGKPFSVKYLIKLLKYLRIRHAMDGVRFIGDLTSDPKRIVAFTELLRESDLALVFSWICDVDIHNVELARLHRMKDNNCASVRVPLPNAQVFQNEVESKALEAAVQTCNALDLPVYVEFKIGFKNDQVEDYLAAVEFCRINEIECFPQIADPIDLFPQADTEARQRFLDNPTRYPALNLSKFKNAELLGAWHAMRMEDKAAIRELGKAEAAG